jgi:hypothetical protein
MPDQLFTICVVSPLVISSISCGNWGNNGCLGKGGFLVLRELVLEEWAGKGR